MTFYIIEPEYESNTTILINTNDGDSTKISTEDINVSQKLAVTYGEIIKSRAVLNEVINNLGLDTSYEQLKSCISVSTVNDTELINITVTYNDSEMSYKIADNLSEVFVNKATSLGNGDNIQIIDSPVVPENKSKPSLITNISISVILGLMFSLFIVFLKEYFNDKITTSEDIERYLKLPLLGIIPLKITNRKIDMNKLQFITSEVYRTIRTNIEFANVDNNIKLILVTSTKQNEGKTTVISELSSYFTELENKKILLLDCDLRNPSIHKQFSISNTQGLTDILMNKKSIEECINYIEIPSLNNNKIGIITTGKTPSNPSELFSSQKMKNLLETLKNDYDYVFIDSPPVGIVSDTSIVSNIVDGSILVVGSGEINIKSAVEAKEKLLNGKTHIIGVILNKSKHLNSKVYSNNYYYGDKEENNKSFILKIKNCSNKIKNKLFK